MSSSASEDKTTKKRGKHAKHAKTETPVEKKAKEAADSAPKHGKGIEEKDDLLFDGSDGEGAVFGQSASGTEGDKTDSKRAKDRPVGVTEAIKKVPEIVDPEEDEPEEDETELVAPVVLAEAVPEPKDRSKLKKGLAIGFGSFFALLLVVYIAGVVVFSDRLYPNTKLGDLDVSMQTSADLRQTLNNRVEGYTLTVTGMDGFSQKFSASEIGLTVDGSVTLSQMVPDRTALTWPVDIFLSHDISRNVSTSYNLLTVQSTIATAIEKHNETATKPSNATIAYNATKKTYEIVPEKLGTALDEAAVSAKIANAIASLSSTVSLTNDELMKPSIVSTDPRLSTALAQAETMSKADVTYTLADAEVARVFPAVIATWITVDENCEATLDEELLTAWAIETAEPLNTRGSERTYTRPDGKVITVSGGDYGWEVDIEAFVEQVQDDVKDGTTKKSAIPCTADGEGEGFTAVGGADWGARYVDVDLDEQYARFYDSDGSLIWECDFISGAPTSDKATPTGVYYIKAKESPSKLIGYLPNGQKDYETTVTYWMPFIRNEIGFHDATWQPGFGGEMYRQGYGSHGCINLSYSDAQDLYSIIQPNDVVVVHE